MLNFPRIFIVPVPSRRALRAGRTRRRKLASYSRRVHRKLGEV